MLGKAFLSFGCIAGLPTLYERENRHGVAIVNLRVEAHLARDQSQIAGSNQARRSPFYDVIEALYGLFSRIDIDPHFIHIVSSARAYKSYNF